MKQHAHLLIFTLLASMVISANAGAAPNCNARCIFSSCHATCTEGQTAFCDCKLGRAQCSCSGTGNQVTAFDFQFVDSSQFILFRDTPPDESTVRLALPSDKEEANAGLAASILTAFQSRYAELAAKELLALQGALKAKNIDAYLQVERRYDQLIARLPREEKAAFKLLTDELDTCLSAESEQTWTEWLNRDTPSGSGDFEIIAEFVKQGIGCSNPLSIQCKLRDGKNWEETGQVYHCDLKSGGVCRNQEQRRGQRCLDYMIRLRCP